MTDNSSKKLNMNYLRLPVAFFGKEGNEQFRHGGERLTTSKVLTLGFLNSVNKNYNNAARVTYSKIKNAFGISAPTSCRNFKEMIADGLLVKTEQSHYKIDVEFDEKNYIILYDEIAQRSYTFRDFSAERRARNNGVYGQRIYKTGKLPRLAQILLAYIIKHYLQFDSEAVDPFCGGKTAIASIIGCKNSTATEAIQTLISAKLIYRKPCEKIYDKEAKAFVVKILQGDGKGKNDKYNSAYIVNSKVLRFARKIKENWQKSKEDSAKSAVSSSQSANRDKKPYPSEQKRRTGGLVEQWQRIAARFNEESADEPTVNFIALDKAEELKKRYSDDAEFNDICKICEGLLKSNDAQGQKKGIKIMLDYLLKHGEEPPDDENELFTFIYNILF